MSPNLRKRFVPRMWVVVAVGLVASSTAIAPAQGQAPEDPFAYPDFPELDVPVPGSAEDPAEVYDETRAGGPPPTLPLEVPAGDFSSRPGAAGAEVRERSEADAVVEEWSETSQVFDHGDGTRTMVLGTEPFQARDDSGEWADLDLDMRRAGDGFAPAVSAIGVEVPSDPASGLVVVDTPSGAVSISAPGLVNGSEPLIVDGGVEVDTVRGGVTSRIEGTATGFEQLLILEDGSGPASYELVFAVPEGMTAAQTGPGITFSDAAGVAVGWFGGSLAWDSARTEDTPPAETSVATTLAGSARGEVRVVVSIDEAWLADPKRVFPVTIDPSWSGTTNSGSSGSDTYVKNGLTSSQWSAAQLNLGYDAYADKVARALFKFNVPEDVNYGVVSATLDVRNTFAWTCTKRPVEVRALTEAFDSSTVWTNAPESEERVGGTASFNTSVYLGSCPAATHSIDVTEVTQRWMDDTLPNNGLELRGADETDGWSYKTLVSGDSASNRPTLSVTYQTVPDAPDAATTAPADGQVVMTEIPTLGVDAVTDPDTSGSVRYWYRLWTDGTDDWEGDVVDSGWLSSTSWTVPRGYLLDGATYHWTAFSTDESGAHVSPTIDRTIRINTRLGSGGSASDGMGPVSVNLATGNASVGVGGVGGVALVYNSQDVPAPGLTGSYYNDENEDWNIQSGEFVMERVDPQPVFDWGLGSPSPAINKDNFLVEWTGTVTVPEAGDYSFGATFRDLGRIVVDGTEVLVAGSGYEPALVPVYDDEITLAANTPYSITIQYAEGAGAADMAVYVKNDVTIDETLLPPSWLRPSSITEETLPGGWTLSAPGDTYGMYKRAIVGNDSIVFETADGGVVEWTRTQSDGWTPEVELMSSTLVVNDDGTITLTEGLVYLFGADGLLQSVTSPSDIAGASGAPTYTWGTYTDAGVDYLRLDTITDGVSGNDVDFVWKTGSQSCTGTYQPAFGSLCEIEAWDGTSTVLEYNSSGNLAKVTNPGTSRWAFYYNGEGLLTELIDPLGFDAVTAGVRGSGKVGWLVDYFASTSFTPRRAKWVQSPPPASDTDPRAVHLYTYGSTYTDVDVTGLTMANGYARRVEFDIDGRQTKERNALNHVTTYVWDTENERIRYVDDSTGMRTSTIYDDLGYPTETWGPAPIDWFDEGSEFPDGDHDDDDIPHSVTGYDEPWATLAATWWDNESLSEEPIANTLGVLEQASGAIDKDWGPGGSPTGVGQQDDWSGRLTGLITFPANSAYQFRVDRDGQVKVWIDDELLIDGWDDDAGFTDAVATEVMEAGSAHRIMIEYADPGGDAELTLQWDDATSGASWETVPAEQLSPEYGLATSHTGPDGDEVETTYPTPWEGNPESTSVDPTGLDLTTSAGYESSGQRRQTSRTLPAQNQWTYAYYGDTESRDNPCTQAQDLAIQAGAQKTRTAPDPGANGAPIVEEAVYDASGRVVATRIGSESWSCVAYDTRGRPVERTAPAFGGEAAREILWDYDVGGNPLIASVTDDAGTITTTIDLLGRPVEQIGVWGSASETTIDYDQAGRVIETDGPEGLQEYVHNDLGQITEQSLDGDVVATVSYDAYGRPQSYAYPSGTGNGGNGTTSDTIVYNDLGRPTKLEWNEADTTLLTSDELTYTIGGRVIDQKIDGTDPYSSGPNFVYDAAGRLTYADMGLDFEYGFDAPDAEDCDLAGDDSETAPDNTNRTTMTVGANTWEYCYDNADRLTSLYYPGVGDLTITYDGHGNTVEVGDEAEIYTYDADNRHLSSSTDTMEVRYRRDATDAIVQREENSTVIARYAGAAQLNTSGTVIEVTLTLPGGPILTKRGTGDVWSYPNLRGEIVATANASGVKQGTTKVYGPFGEDLAGIPDNATGNFDIGWSGVNYTEHASSLLPAIEMGARLYQPMLGRFLQVDPVEGGSANPYEYAAGDPINNRDFSGRECEGMQVFSVFCVGLAIGGLGLIAYGMRNTKVDCGFVGCHVYLSTLTTLGLNKLRRSGWLHVYTGLFGALLCWRLPSVWSVPCSMAFFWAAPGLANAMGAPIKAARQANSCLTIFINGWALSSAVSGINWQAAINSFSFGKVQPEHVVPLTGGTYIIRGSSHCKDDAGWYRPPMV